VPRSSSTQPPDCNHLAELAHHQFVTAAEDFTEFAAAAAPRLRRTAYLLCGDWHAAEDLAQTALAKAFVAWRRISKQESAHAYATRTLVNTYLSERRLRRSGEVLSGTVPERPAEPQSPDDRIVLLGALAKLPPKARAVVVLRYWNDLSVDQAAAVLGCSAGNVKSQSARALDKLRTLLAESGDGDGEARPTEAQHG
jgi:RNA polymerase sigma-70 factor (sigma-E family)